MMTSNTALLASLSGLTAFSDLLIAARAEVDDTAHSVSHVVLCETF